MHRPLSSRRYRRVPETGRLLVFLPLILPALAGGISRIAYAETNSVRLRQSMDSGWRFHLAAGRPLEQEQAVTGWRWKADSGARAVPTSLEAPASAPDTGDSAWQPVHYGDDVFHGRHGYTWFQATLPEVPGPHRVLHFDGVDDNASVYLNGKLLLQHNGWTDPFDVPLDPAWRTDGPNVIMVRVENIDGPGGISRPVRLGREPATEIVGDPSRFDFDDHGWRTVHLPHDYVVEGAFSPTADNSHASLPVRTAWYRKTFTLPAAYRGKSVWIDFDGVYRDAVVYLNGRRLGEHACGYTGFRYDISSAANYGGRNVLSVSVDPRHFEGWFYEGGGIYRHVWLNVADPLHIAPWGSFVVSRLPEPKGSRPVSAATLSIRTTLVNARQAPAPCRLVYMVLDDQGRTVASSRQASRVVGNHIVSVATEVTVPHPRLWSLETPHLYRLVTRVEQAGRIVDTDTTDFGIRTIRFDPDHGFFLNGRHVEIKGTCNHQDFAGVGIGVPDRLQYWRVQRLKAMGSNAWRMSHNAPTPALLDACDRLGMLVMDENRHLGDTESAKASPGTGASDLSELESMILRDRNHPSVIMWSLCNEEPVQGTADGARIFAAMQKRVIQADPSRPITSAMNGGFGQGTSDVEDLQGFNYNIDAYDEFHRAHPRQPAFGSETASAVSTRGIYADDRLHGFVTAYDERTPGDYAATAQSAWKAIADRPYMAGAFVWTGFDYRGEPSPFNWPNISSNFGILDTCGFPKDDYYYYQSVWSNTPMVHLLPHWSWPGREGQAIAVWCYSNAARVNLLLNGRSLGSKAMPGLGHLAWSVPYIPGTLEARAYDRQGKVVARDRVETTGAPAALRLTTDRTILTADGEDMTAIEVSVVDAQGRVVPTAADLVTFQVQGAGTIAGVGNGDPTSHEADRAAQRHTFNGHCLVLIGAREQPGAIGLMASAPGLRSARLRLTAQRR